MKDVSIIIVNYNTLDVTLNCIDSIFRHTKKLDFEVIVVDNASTDGSAEVLSKDSRIRFVKSDVNRGFGNANNLGYQFASGKYIFLLNSDTLLLNNAIKFLYDAFETLPNGDVACLGCILLAKNGMEKIHSYGEFPSLSNMFLSLCRTYLRLSQKKKRIGSVPFYVDYITGADLFIKKSLIDKLGFFDTDFFMYYEETELQYRYNKAGYKSMIIPTGPQIIHLEGGSSAVSGLQNKRPKYWSMYFHGMFTYMRKRYNIILYLFFRLLAFGYMPLIVRKYTKKTDKMEIVKIFMQ